MKNELEHVYFCFLALIWIIHLARILRLVSAWECVLYRADYGSWELSYTASVTWMSLIKKCPHCHCPGLNPVHLHGTLSGPVYKINTLRHTLLVLVIHFWALELCVSVWRVVATEPSDTWAAPELAPDAELATGAMVHWPAPAPDRGSEWPSIYCLIHFYKVLTILSWSWVSWWMCGLSSESPVTHGAAQCGNVHCTGSHSALLSSLSVLCLSSGPGQGSLHGPGWPQ